MSVLYNNLTLHQMIIEMVDNLCYVLLYLYYRRLLSLNSYITYQGYSASLCLVILLPTLVQPIERFTSQSDGPLGGFRLEFSVFAIAGVSGQHVFVNSCS